MLMLLVTLFTFLLFKTPLSIPGDLYVVLAVQGIAGLYGLVFLLRNRPLAALEKYWTFLAYVVVLWLTAVAAGDARWVAAQALALTSVLIFFVAFAEGYDDIDGVQRLFFVIVGAEIIVACLGSLVYLKAGGLAAIDTSVAPWRYKGLFSKPAELAAASGLLVVLAVVCRWPVYLKLIGGTVGLANLWLAGSRSFLVAGAVAAAVSLILCSRWRWLLVWGGAVAILSGAYIVLLSGMPLPARLEQALRPETLSTMSGRTDIWSLGFERFLEKPILGYGFTRGADAYKPYRTKIIRETGMSSPVLGENPVLDSGYMQSLLDSGVLGFALYVAIIGGAIYHAVRLRHHPSGAPIIACIVYLALGNLAETIIFSAIKFQSILFWYLAVVAARSFAPYAHDCIMVRVPREPTGYKVAAR
jgi:O-antigen ligase